MLERIPWHGGETVVVAAPTFHAWGFGQLVIAATMACTVVLRRRFDPEATLALADEHRATGIARGAGDARADHGAAGRGARPLLARQRRAS